MKKDKFPFQNGLIVKVLAFAEDDIIVGTGWVTYLNDGSFGSPIMFDLAGNKLEPGWYNVTVTGESHLAVIPNRIQ